MERLEKLVNKGFSVFLVLGGLAMEVDVAREYVEFRQTNFYDFTQYFCRDYKTIDNCFPQEFEIGIGLFVMFMGVLLYPIPEKHKELCKNL